MFHVERKNLAYKVLAVLFINLPLPNSIKKFCSLTQTSCLILPFSDTCKNRKVLKIKGFLKLGLPSLPKELTSKLKQK